MFFNDPEEFEEFLFPIAGDVLIRPEIGKIFNTEISMESLQSVGLFTVSANSYSRCGICMPMHSHACSFLSLYP